jgi:hypothetical protein
MNNEFDNVEKLDKFLDICILPKPNQYALDRILAQQGHVHQ